MKEKKEMISVSERDGKIYVKINYSSMSLINTCLRKSQYVLERGLTSSEESTALVFGTAIHKALEVWYSSNPEERKELPKGLKEKISLEVFGTPQGEHPAFRAARAFSESGISLSSLPDDDKRGRGPGAKILAAYFERYANDGFEVYSDAAGPAVERRADYVMYDSAGLQVTYFGTIDCILKNSQTGIVCVVDHKTTSALGTDFFNRLKPNHQYTGYVWLAQKALGIPTDLFLINGIQTAKTIQQFARQFTTRTEEDFAELKEAVLFSVRNYLYAKEQGVWPMNSPDPCATWGGCQFIRVCEVPSKLRENVIQGKWGSL